jgi:hypothetical protein
MGLTEIEGLGAASQVPRTSNADLAQLKLSPEEGFVLSRVDGRTSLEHICMLVPFPLEQTTRILNRLWLDGAIDLPGKARPVKPPVIVQAERPKIPTPAAPRVRSDTPTGSDITEGQKKRVDEVFGALETRDAFALLEIGRDADAKEIKRAYFRLSKEFHPDRYYKRDLGVYGERLTRIFQAVKNAFELLSDDKRRQTYLENLPPPR